VNCSQASANFVRRPGCALSSPQEVSRASLSSLLHVWRLLFADNAPTKEGSFTLEELGFRDVATRAIDKHPQGGNIRKVYEFMLSTSVQQVIEQRTAFRIQAHDSPSIPRGGQSAPLAEPHPPSSTKSAILQRQRLFHHCPTAVEPERLAGTRRELHPGSELSSPTGGRTNT